VLAVTSKAEYRDIVPAMAPIDCGFSPRVVAVNSVLNLLGTETARVHAILHRCHAYVYEFTVHSGSRVCNRRIAECEKTPTAIFFLVFRDGQPMPATGDLTLRAGDRVTAIATPETEKSLALLFRPRTLFGL
jgi:Trk K+ transport system NAD-binding subunit